MHQIHVHYCDHFIVKDQNITIQQYMYTKYYIYTIQVIWVLHINRTAGDQSLFHLETDHSISH